MLQKKSILLKESRQNCTDMPRNFIIDYRNRLKKIIHSAEWSYYKELFKKNEAGTKRTWQIINKILSKSKGSIKPKLFRDEKGTLYDDAQIAEAFNDFFVNIGPELSKTIHCSSLSYTTFLTPSLQNSKVFEFCDAQEIKIVIQNLKSTCRIGYDGFYDGSIGLDRLEKLLVIY